MVEEEIWDETINLWAELSSFPWGAPHASTNVQIKGLRSAPGAAF